MGLRPTQGMKIGLRKAWLAITPYFVISTGAGGSPRIYAGVGALQRSGKFGSDHDGL